MPEHYRHPADAKTRLPHVGTYRRVLPVSLERLYENAVDWEHLPHLHASSFRSLHCLDAGAWGFRAAVEGANGSPATIELRLDRELRRWITRTLSGRNAGAEVWTHAFPIERRRTDIVVDFFVPGVEPVERDRVGAAFSALYSRLYDEDVAMMVERQRQLDRRVGGGGQDVSVGPLEDLQIPVRVTYRGRDFWIVRQDSNLLAYAAQCPHQLGPLPAQPDADGCVSCPWHGYGFDVVTGKGTGGHGCRLPPAPRVVVRDGEVCLRAPVMGAG